MSLTDKKTRLLCEDDVIKAVDKHTNDDGSLDDDISCILEEVKDVIIAGSKNAMKELNKPITGIMPAQEYLCLKLIYQLKMQCKLKKY